MNNKDAHGTMDVTDCAGNPIITSIFTADPSAHVWPTDPNRLYLYPSTDIFPARGCDRMDQYHVFSTENMVDWIDHGEILRRDDLPEDTWGPHYPDQFFMWAPDAAYNENCPEGRGPYFFYFPHKTNRLGESDKRWMVGIAWSDSPYKGFKDHEVLMLKDKDGNPIGGYIDPCVFRDGDDYYMVIGGGQECRIAKMMPNMVQLAEDYVILTQNNAHQKDSPYYNKIPYYHEGPWMFARVNDRGEKIYYLVYPGRISEQGDDILYAISDNPYGPWEYKGSVLKPTGTGDTSQCSIVEFKGKWYMFYHNAELSGGFGNLRSVCVDELFFNPDGTIVPVEQTKTGVKAVGPRVPADTPGLEVKYYELTGYNPADYTEETTCPVTGDNCQVVNADLADGLVQNMQNEGAYIEFSGIDGKQGGRALLTVIYSAQDRAAAKVYTSGDREGKGYFLKVPSTGGWDITGRTSCLIDLLPGPNNTIRISGGMGGFNVQAIVVATRP